MDNISPVAFAEEEFARINREAFDAYIEYRLNGEHAHRVFTRLFGPDEQCDLKCEFLEHNPYYQKMFLKRLHERRPEDLWDEHKAIHAYLEIFKNPFFKDSTRLAAVKELNVLLGITEVDDAGRTRKTPSLGDLYDHLT